MEIKREITLSTGKVLTNEEFKEIENYILGELSNYHIKTLEEDLKDLQRDNLNTWYVGSSICQMS